MLGITDAIELSRKIGELVKSGITIDLQEKVVELRTAVLNAKEEMLALRAENLALKNKEREAAAWEETAKLYPLVETPGGAMVRHTDGPPPHYACPRCFVEHQKIYPLQDHGLANGHFDCPNCNKSFPVAAVKQYTIGTSQPGGPDGWMGN